MLINSDFDKLTQIFPLYIKESLTIHPNKGELIEIILDLGRKPEGRFTFGCQYLSDKIVSWQDIQYITKRVGKFDNDNRTGIKQTLHRVSCLKNRQGLIVGLTCRVGRSIVGNIGLIRDILIQNKSILVLGKPGGGKTTLIREISRILANEMKKRVVIVDTSNEIAGDSDIPHPGIGKARRMQVARSENQHDVMIEAVENHMPEVIVVDEIGTELETLAARTIAERGVKLVGTVHGNSLESLIKNPVLGDLVGGIQYVTLSDDEARRRGTQKSVLERKSLPAFEVAIELNESNVWTIHSSIEHSVDSLLRGQLLNSEIRSINESGQIKINMETILSNLNPSFKSDSQQKTESNHNFISKPNREISNSNNNNNLAIEEINKKSPKHDQNHISIYSYSLSTNKIEKICKSFGVKIVLTKQIEKAQLILTSKLFLKQNNELREIAKKNHIPIYALNNNTTGQITKAMKQIIQMNDFK